MTITRRIITATAAAMLAGLTVSTATTAWADQAMNGHYTVTQNGTTWDLYFTPCGDGCASAAYSDGTPVGQAQLANGQWTLDMTRDAACNDGTVVPSGSQSHLVWDANTLAGTDTSTWKPGVCPNDARTGTDTIQLTQVP